MTQNSKSKLTFHIRRQTKKLDTARNNPRMKPVPAWLGDLAGNVTTYNGNALPDGFVVIRYDNGNLEVAWNKNIGILSAGIPIYVGYDPVIQPTLFQVLGQRDVYPLQAPFSLPSHHKTHEYPGQDTVLVHSEQVDPALVTANNGFTLTVHAFFCPVSTGGWVRIFSKTIDMTPYKPATGTQAFAICARDDGTISVVAGGTVATPEILTAAQFPPMPDATYHPLCAVRLYSSQGSIRQGVYSPDLYDLRAWAGGGSGGGGYLPPATTATNDFQVGDGATPGHWIKKTLAETKTILGVSAGTTFDTEANLLASTPTENTFAVADDTNYLYYFIVGSGWFRTALESGAKSSPDIGINQLANDYEIFPLTIGHKTLVFGYIGAEHDALDASPNKVALRSNNGLLQVNFGSGWNGLNPNFINGVPCSQVGNYFMSPIGNSVQYVDTGLPAAGLNGVPTIQNWTHIDIGAYPAAIPLSGGTY